MPVSFATTDDLATVIERLVALESAPTVDLSPINARIDSLEARVAALEVVPPPDEPPPPPPPDPEPAKELNLQLLGGWRLEGPFSRGQLAINHDRMKAFVVGHAQRNEIYEYDLPTYGAGNDIAAYPRLARTNLIPLFWEGGYASGMIWDGQLKVCPKRFYDTNPPPTSTIFAQDGTKQTISVPRQRFGGFVKGAGSLELGGGGYESGQGFAKGPTLAKLDGTILIDHLAQSTFEQACSREPNYWPADGKDSWVCWSPRDGVGKWACDRVHGGGLRFSHGIYFWAWMGTGDLNYNRQTETFGLDTLNRTYLYRYDPLTYQLAGWKETSLGKVCGQEISPDGKYVYLIEADAWKSGAYQVDPVLKIYEVK